MENNNLNKSLADILGKMDKKTIEEKLNQALNIIKKSNNEELAKKVNQVDKKEIIDKISSIDPNKLKDLNISQDQLKKLGNSDIDKLSKSISENGNDLAKRLKDIIK